MLALTLSEREEISRGLATGQSLRSIAQLLGRSPSTISREVKRNGGPEQYRSAGADSAAGMLSGTLNPADLLKSCKTLKRPMLIYMPYMRRGIKPQYELEH